MFQKIIRFCVKLVQKYLPEPFIFAVVLTLLAFSIFNVAKINSEFKRLETIVADSSNKGAEETIKPVYHFSRTGKNVVVIMLDRGISSFVPYIMDELDGLLRFLQERERKNLHYCAE